MMCNALLSGSIEEDLKIFFKEDGFSTNFYYLKNLPDDLVNCTLFFKSDMVAAGLPYFFECFKLLGADQINWNDFNDYEGQPRKSDSVSGINFTLPFSIALTGERIALNLLQHASKIATYTSKFVARANKHGISILDTRKTTPGLRTLEKYAVRVGGGHNHRFGQTDQWMIKDNHKSFFGGLKGALEYFNSIQSFYAPIIVEIHSITELKEAIDLGIKHVMLDNFSPKDIKEAMLLKTESHTFEVSGGINLDNLENYLITGVDAISIGALTYGAPSVDISLKYKR